MSEGFRFKRGGHYERVGREIGRKIDRFIAGYDIDPGTVEHHREYDENTKARDVFTRVKEIDQQVRRRDAWETAIALIDLAEKQLSEPVIVEKLAEIDAREAEIKKSGRKRWQSPGRPE